MSDRPKDEKNLLPACRNSYQNVVEKLKKRNYVNRMDFFRLFFKNGAFGNI
jgi:hypothetical protein